jgi:hypothetical protein
MMNEIVMRKQNIISILFIIVAGLLLILGTGSCGDESPVDPDDPGGGNGGPDTIPPAAVTEMYARAPTASTIALVWLAPGDDGSTGQASSYDLRYSRSIITEQNWDSATPVTGLPGPKPASYIETVVATGLPSSTRLHFALKTSDEAHNVSAISNNAIDSTLVETTAPAALTDLKAVAISGTEFKLAWTAPGDDYMSGTASAYDIRYSFNAINTNSKWSGAIRATGEPAPAPGGSPDSFIVTGLEAGANYHFALKTVDDIGNWSGLSNPCPALGLGNLLWVSPVKANSLEDVTITFQASPTERTIIHIWHRTYIPGTGSVWYIVRHLVNEMYAGGVQLAIWDTTDDSGNPIDNRWDAETVRVELKYGSTLIATLDMQIFF